MHWRRRSMAASAALGLAITGCAPASQASLPPSSRLQAVGSTQCPGLRNVDLAALNAQIAERMAQPASIEYLDGVLSLATSDDSATRHPPADAPVVIRARIPAGGMHSLDDRAVVWRETDGTWWMWRIQINYRAPQPPPMPPVPADHPDPEAFLARERSYRENYFSVPRPLQGRVAPEHVAALEAALGDPCRVHDPDGWLNSTPLIHREEGRDVRLCPLDSATVVAEITEPGRAPRRIYAACANDTPTYRLMTAALGATPAP